MVRINMSITKDTRGNACVFLCIQEVLWRIKAFIQKKEVIQWIEVN